VTGPQVRGYAYRVIYPARAAVKTRRAAALDYRANPDARTPNDKLTAGYDGNLCSPDCRADNIVLQPLVILLLAENAYSALDISAGAPDGEPSPLVHDLSFTSRWRTAAGGAALGEIQPDWPPPILLICCEVMSMVTDVFSMSHEAASRFGFSILVYFAPDGVRFVHAGLL